jgi:general stress protein 26
LNDDEKQNSATLTREQVAEALEHADVLALSTINVDGSSWVSPVGYEHDDQLNLYFDSRVD